MKRRIYILSIIVFLLPITVFSSEWTIQQNPIPNGNDLLAIWGSSSTDVFATVVDYYDGVSVIHYDGSTWSIMRNINIGSLRGVWGSSSTDVFAVRNNDIFHYDGSAWSSMTNPLSGGKAGLRGVWGSSGSDVFAVGELGTILHYDGSAWSSMTNPLSGTKAQLNNVWGSSPTDVFAVGEDLYSGNGIILHYNGADWSSMTNPLIVSDNTEDYLLLAIWGSSSTDVFAVGLYNSTNYYKKGQGLILHYDGSAWSIIFSNTNSEIRGVWGSNGTDVFAVGDYWNNSMIDSQGNITPEGIIFHYDGIAWSTMFKTSNKLIAVWGSSSTDVFAVGELGTILHYREPVKTTTIPVTTTTTTISENCPPDYPVDCANQGTPGCCKNEYPICCGNLCCRQAYPYCGRLGKKCYKSPPGLCAFNYLLTGDTWTLNKLRKVRDNILSKTEKGREYVVLFYANSPEIISLLKTDNTIRNQAMNMLYNIMPDVITSLESDKIVIEQVSVDEIENLCNMISSKATPKLKKAIKKLRRDIKEEKIIEQLELNGNNGNN